MRTVGIREAKLHLSELVAAVERGEEVEVTRRGTPIARIVPFDRRTGRAVRLGRFENLGRIDPSFYDEMSEEELADWYGDDTDAEGSSTAANPSA